MTGRRAGLLVLERRKKKNCKFVYEEFYKKKHFCSDTGCKKIDPVFVVWALVKDIGNVGSCSTSKPECTRASKCSSFGDSGKSSQWRRAAEGADETVPHPTWS